ncbi:MAG: RHS repeat-associated core domain-containing protein [Polyangiaceae bacterium]
MKRALMLGLFFAAAAAIHCGSGGGDANGGGGGGDVDAGGGAQGDAGGTTNADAGVVGDGGSTADASALDSGADDASVTDASGSDTGVDAGDDAGDASLDAASDAATDAEAGAPPLVNATVFAYDQSDRVIGEYDQSGKPLEELVYLGDRVIATVRDGKALAVQTDQLGTPRTVLSGTSPVWSWDPEPFGDTPPNEDVDGDGKKVVFDERFPGQRHDAISGFAYNFHRNYAPEWGRYVEADPIGLAGGMNVFAYASANPLTNSDPQGLRQPQVSITTMSGQNISIAGATATGLVATLEKAIASGDSIASLSIIGHGSAESMGGMGMANGLAAWLGLGPTWEPLMVTGGEKVTTPDGVDVGALLRKAMARGGQIYLNGCSTASRGRWKSIARTLAREVPDVMVTGNYGIALDTFGTTETGTFARPVSYIGGDWRSSSGRY